ncbi:hypothetical protein [Gorillibacterium sp. CAU 1737]|uniref:hypothetical protein n=1 Tax=Gorillibacterium sp. CAU 1737 TaxID=3140362 RepID=UPI0032610717
MAEVKEAQLVVRQSASPTVVKALQPFDQATSRFSRMASGFQQAAQQMERLTRALEQGAIAMRRATEAQRTMTQGMKNTGNKTGKTTDGGNSGKASASKSNGFWREMASTFGPIIKTKLAELLVNKIIQKFSSANTKNTTGSSSSSAASDKKTGGFRQKMTDVGGAFKSLIPVGQIKQLASSSIKGALENQKTRDLFIAKTGSNQQGGAMYDTLRKQAVQSGVKVDDSMKGSMAMLSKTQDVGQVSKLSGLAQRLAAFDSSGGGIGEAMTQINDVMSGSLDSLAARLKLPKDKLMGLNLEKLAAGKDWDGLTKALDQVMTQQGMGQDRYQDLQQQPTQQLDTLKNNATAALQDAGMGAVAALQPLLTMLNEAFQEGKFQPFFDAIAVGFQFIGSVVMEVASFIMEHLDTIKLILLAIGIAAAIFGAIWLVSWLIAALPVIAIIALIVVILLALQQMGVTTDQIIGFVMGVFYGLFAFLWNSFAFLQNIILSVAEFLINVFNDPIYAIKKLFFDIFNSVADFVNGIIGGIISGVNKVLGFINKVTGSSFGEIEQFAIQKFDTSQLKSDKDVISLDKYKMEMKDVKEWSQKGYDKGSGIGSKLGGATDKLNSFGKGWGDAKNPAADSLATMGAGSALTPTTSSPAVANIGNVDRVGSIGKVDDTVSVSSEDMEMMHDLAEMQSIQNFVSLTPTVNVKTGDIKNGYDIDTIIGRIQSSLENEIAISAQGVYG